jgi:hypothetical protein
MSKLSTATTKYEWVGIDLHVHTPASKDYQGPDDDAEFISIIKRANEFEDPNTTLRKARPGTASRPIRCIAFTDHNSVDGFRRWKTIYDETVKLAGAIGDKDPNNSLLQKLDSDIAILRSVRVLMGFELKAYPGIHLLFIFHESVSPDEASVFLSDVYQRSYEEINGLPDPATASPLVDVLNKAADVFGDRFIVIAPHIESGGGIYEALKDLVQARMQGLTHPALRALSFNKEETRERVRNLLSQPAYSREIPLAFIQSSDAHGSRGTVGQPRSEVHVPNGRATFTTIKEALLHSTRVKCSVDFADEEYRRITEDETVAKFAGLSDPIRFRDEDHSEVAKFACAALNSDNGIIELDVSLRSTTDLAEAYPERIVSELESIIEKLLEPSGAIVLNRALSFSANRVRILFKPIPNTRLYAMSGSVYVLDGKEARLAHAFEIESVVAERINARFGSRFQKALERVSEDSILLSKLPRGIPLFIRCREHLAFLTPKMLGTERFAGIAEKGRELLDEAKHLYDDVIHDAPFGLCRGNTNLLWSKGEVRAEEHYARFLAFRAEIRQDIAEKYAATQLKDTAIAVSTGGGTYLCDEGYLLTRNPTLVIRMPEKWAAHKLASLAWLKSSFFIWYCAVHLSDKNLYQQLQDASVRLPFPKISHEQFYRRLGSLAQNMLIDEKRFLEELQREMKRGLNSEQREKLRKKHNASANAICLSIDDEISKMLSLSESESEFISKTLRDMELTDFGFLDRLESQRKIDEDDKNRS